MRWRFVRRVQFLLTGLCLLVLAACGGGDPGSACTGASPASAKDTCVSASGAAADVASVRIAPDAATIATDQTATLTAQALDANGNVLSGKVFSFASNNVAIAKVADPASNPSTVTGVSEGVALITASSAGKSAIAVVTVRSRADIQVTGRVVDGQTRAGLAGAQVEIRNGSFATTGADGAYSFSIPYILSDQRPLTASLTGYSSTTIAVLITPPSTEIEPILLVRDKGVSSIINGSVRNARNNQALPGALVTLSRGQNISVAAAFVASTTADSQGGYSFVGLRAGTYTVAASVNEFSNCQRTAIAVAANEAVVQDVVCSPINGNEIRIVLTWGANPSDLDAHLTGPNSDASRFHVYYPTSNRGNASASPFAVLDVDDTSSFGPETITVTRFNSGAYRYSVHDFTNRNSATSTALGNSGAKVELYTSSSMAPQTFFVPNQRGTLWTVFELTGDIRNPTVTPRNEMGLVDNGANIQ